MARPIKETPILTGEDVKRFNEMRKAVSPAPEHIKVEIKKNFDRLNAIANF